MKYAKDASDVFISLSPDKFVKISDENPNTQPGNEILNHYLNKKIEYVYIDRAQFTALIKSYRDNIVNFHNPDEKIELAGHIFHLSLNCLNAMGINQFQIELTNGIVEETINELNKEKSIIEKFKKIYDSEGYIVAHSMLLVHIASAILKKSPLNHFVSMKKISMAAFLHDMSLIDDELALFESDIQSSKSNPDRVKLLAHPINSGNLLTSHTELFDETRKIIVEHHEKPDGTGYPKGTHGNHLFILSALFILSHDITLHLIKNNYKSDQLRHFLISNKEYYSVGHFEKFYQLALEILN
jgi:HD-GYP domain-containing protein (c-di-GMP phosphodiesterase class II)